MGAERSEGDWQRLQLALPTCKLAVERSETFNPMMSLVHSYGAHSPSRVVVGRLRLLGSDNSRLGLHRLTKRYSIVLSALTQQGEPEKSTCISKCFFQRCVPQAERDASFGSEVRFAHEVCLRHVKRNISHHCDRREQHHYAKHNITLA